MSASPSTACRPSFVTAEIAGPASQPAAALVGWERPAVATLFVLQLALRIALAFRQTVDTDEPQHLHVAWAWTQGLVPYRDVFDNHAPLFHALAAPLVAAIGERPEILVAMRLVMIPIAAVTLGCLVAIGRRLFSLRVGLWAAVLVGLMPSFLLTSAEFRADDLWVALWLAAIAIALIDPLDRRHAFFAGLLFGLTFATSMKTTLLFVTLGWGLALALWLDPQRGARLRERRLWISLAACAAGVVLPFLVVAALFARVGAFADLIDYVFRHNMAGADLWDHRLARVAMFVVSLPLVIGVGWAIVGRSIARPVSRAAVLLATLLYATMLNGFWPLVTRQDWLSFYALLAVFLVAGIFELARRGERASVAALAMIAVIEVVLTLHYGRPWRNGTRFEAGLLRDVLRLTRPTDTVMDLKGETVFRRRPFFYALENITQERIRIGELRDDIVERLIATRTYVSVVDSPRFPPRARQFLLDNYLPVGHLRVAGMLLAVDGSGQASFTLALAGRYAILSPSGPVRGRLDDRPLDGPQTLAPGEHTFVPSTPTAPLALVWADAAELGFSPFHPGDSL